MALQAQETRQRQLRAHEAESLRLMVEERDANIEFIRSQLEHARSDLRQLSSQSASDQTWIHDLLDQVRVLVVCVCLYLCRGCSSFLLFARCRFSDSRPNDS